MTDAETTILDSARYVRQIRPIDPAELVTYVGTEATIEWVRSVLREHAFDLGLIERADGTFVPVSENRMIPTRATVKKVPDWVDTVLEDLLCDRFGDAWHAGTTGDQLREAIRACKAAYFADEPVIYDETTAIGYAIYHLPTSYATTRYVLGAVGPIGFESHTLRILEVGAGVGGSTIGLLDQVGSDCLLSYHVIESSEPALTVLDALVAREDRNVHWTIDHATIEAASLAEEYDLIVCSKVVSELDDPRSVLDRLSDHLAADGYVMIIEPADERTSRCLRTIESDIVRNSALGVYSPTIRLWSGRQPTTADWSFDERPAIAIPTVQRKLDEGPRAGPENRDPATGEFVNVAVRYSYSMLRADDRTRIDFRPRPKQWTPLAEVPNRISERLDVAVVKLSNSIAPDGANPVYVIGDGSQLVEHFAVQTVTNQWNVALKHAAYGDVLLMRRVLALWNDDEQATNLVVDAESTIKAVPPTGIRRATDSSPSTAGG